MANSPLANVIEVPTSLPVPRLVDDGSSPPDRVGLRISSEFTTHIAPISLVDGNHKIALVQDKDGQPLLFSIGNNQRFMCFAHENGASEAWQSYDITPSSVVDGKVSTFDVTESALHLVLAVGLPVGSRTKVFTSVCKKANFNPADVKWVDRSPGHDGPDVVSSLLCGGSDAAGNATVTVGTEASDSLAATYYQLDTNPSNDFPWVPSPLPENAQRILQVVPGRLTGNLGVGYYVLYSQAGDSVSGLGQVRDIHSAITPYTEYTDLFAATERGIAYFSHFRPDKQPQVLLPEVSFRQVVAAEYGTRILVFAVSEQRELYYLEGTRKSSVVFNYSGFPIRAGVEMLSVAYNTAADATELMYVSTGQHTIKHLWRDPVSFSWQEAALTILAPKDDSKKPKTRRFPAYVTAVTVVNETTGESIGSGYELAISSDLVFVTINDSTYSLTKRQVKVKTDSFGRITIIQEVSDALSSPSYTLHLRSGDPKANSASVDVPIHPAQRVIQQLSKYTTAESLSNAKTSDGRKVNFRAGAEANFAGTASLLGQFGSLVQTADPKIGKQLVPDSKPIGESDAIAFEIDTKGRTVRQAGGWLKEAALDVVEFFGDIWETIKCGLKTAFKFAVKVIGKAVQVFVWIAGKVYNFVAHTVGPLLRSVAGFLKDTLGVDLNGFLDWLGFSFDWEKIKKTQKQLIEFGTGLLGSMSDFFVVNRPVIEETIQIARSVLSDYIKDTRVPLNAPGKPKKPNPIIKLLGWLFNNPILQFIMKYNPITWLMGEVADIIGEDVRLPDISSLASIFTDILPNLAGDQLDLITQFGKSLMDVLQRLLSREIDFGTALKELLGDVFWSIFDSLTGVAMALFDAAGKFFVALFNVFTQEIKIPLITDLWTALTDQPFTIMNVLTLVPAFALNTYYLAKYNKLPFDEAVLGNPLRYLPTKEQIKFPSVVDLALGVMPPGLSDADLARVKQEVRRNLGVDIESAPIDTPKLPSGASAGILQVQTQESAMFSFQAPALEMHTMRIVEMTPEAEMELASDEKQSLMAMDEDHDEARYPPEKLWAETSVFKSASLPQFVPTSAKSANLDDSALDEHFGSGFAKEAKASSASSHHDHDENHAYHKGEVICGMIGSIISLLSTGVEVLEAKAHHNAGGHHDEAAADDQGEHGGHGAVGQWKPLEVAKVFLGCLGCINRFASFCIMRATPDFSASFVGKHGAGRAIGVFLLSMSKGFALFFNAFEVYLSFKPNTEVITSFLRVISNVIGCGISGVIEFFLSHIEGAGPWLRLIADQLEWAAAAAGAVAVIGAKAGEPNTIAWALGTNGVLDAINVGLNGWALAIV